MSETQDRQAWALPLPSLFAQVRELFLSEQHRRLEQEGFAGLRFGHGCVYRFIDTEGSRLTILAERSGLTKQAVGEAVSELERLGYVQRVADPHDGRAKVIRLTQRGREGQAAAARVLANIEHQWGQRVGHDRITGLRRTLEDLVAGQHAPTNVP